MSDGDAGARDDIARLTIWLFHGDRARYAAGVFTTRDAGLAWAVEHRVTGILASFSPGFEHVHLTDGQPSIRS